MILQKMVGKVGKDNSASCEIKIHYLAYKRVSLSVKDPATSRTLTLISKTIQTLGSLAKSKSVSFSD